MKRTRTVILAICLIAVLSIGATWAYLNKVTNEETNVFTFLGEGLNAILTEPNWVPSKALNLTPGAIVPKDPLVTNTGLVDEYVGLKLTFQTKNASDTVVSLSDIQYTTLMKCIQVQYNSTPTATATWVNGYNPAWVIVKSAETGKPTATYYYDQAAPLAAAVDANTNGTIEAAEYGAKTAPIFDRIVFKDTMSNELYAWLAGKADYVDDNGTPGNPADDVTVPKLIEGFKINVKGSAVQQSAFTTAPGYTEYATVKTTIADALWGLVNP